MNSTFNLDKGVKEALTKEEQRSNFRRATTTLRANSTKIFNPEEKEKMRRNVEYSKKKVLANLPDLLERFEEKCKENGIIVHWARDAEEARSITFNIAKKHDVKKIVKGKSMISEEIHLNPFLQEQGIQVVETDLGEFIIQLNGEPPSHIIVPAVHKNRYEIGRIFENELKVPYTDDVQELNAIARKSLREHFATADMGISGVNFAIANSGAILLVENEGNGRMCTTVPKVHVAFMGLERIVESFDDIPACLRLLTGSATGQLITTYVNIITGTRKPNEKDGPSEVHVIIVDNGRSAIYANEKFRSTLQCIRCGACLNNCPVYINIGGHAYQSVYPGPIGEILTTQLEGIEAKGELVSASSLCQSCSEVCPALIPIAQTIRNLREERVNKHGVVKGAGSKSSKLEAFSWKAWSWMNRSPRAYYLLLSFLTTFGFMIPKVSLLKQWTKGRAKPRFASKSLHSLVKKEDGVRYE
ncbi:MAG: iron-sulfur cluster-binding protein [Desulfovibrionaceae bacterium]|nr:iron-sulfur cluster-binding protein [Desulfovibrionaceae bacterium]